MPTTKLCGQGQAQPTWPPQPKLKKKIKIYIRLLRCSTARGSCSGLSLIGPTKVKARKSFLFAEGSLKVENKEHLVDFVVTLYFTSLCSNALCSSKVSQLNLSVLVVTGCL